MDYPLGAKDDPSAPYNEVPYTVSADVDVTKRVSFVLSANPNISERDLEDAVQEKLREEYGEDADVYNITFYKS